MPAGWQHATVNHGQVVAAGVQQAWPASQRLAAGMAVLQSGRRGVQRGAGASDVSALLNAALGFLELLQEATGPRVAGHSATAGAKESLLRTAGHRRRAAKAALKHARRAVALAPLCLRAHFVLLRACGTAEARELGTGGGCDAAAALAAAHRLAAAISEIGRATPPPSEELLASAHHRLGVWFAQAQHGVEATAHLCEHAATRNPHSRAIRRDCMMVAVAAEQ